MALKKEARFELEASASTISNISINDGIINWTKDILKGEYNFKVKATYDNQSYVSQSITLTIINEASHTYTIEGGSKTLNGKKGIAGSDYQSNQWNLYKDGQIQTIIGEDLYIKSLFL